MQLDGVFVFGGTLFLNIINLKTIPSFLYLGTPRVLFSSHPPFRWLSALDHSSMNLAGSKGEREKTLSVPR